MGILISQHIIIQIQSKLLFENLSWDFQVGKPSSELERTPVIYRGRMVWISRFRSPQ